MSITTTGPTKKRSSDPKENLVDFKLDISRDADATWEQRDNANEDMRFVNVDGGQWEGFLEDQFNDRTKLEFDIVSNYLQRFLGEWDLNRIGIEFKPDDSTGKTSDEDAELLNGIWRADFRQFSGKLAVDNAVNEAATCGYGAFKLATKFEDEEDGTNDFQRIEFRPLHNAFNTVFWDRGARRIDKRDARRVTVLTEFTRESFKDIYPDEDAVSAYEPWSRRAWNISLNRVEVIYIATRYEVVRKKENHFIYDNLVSGEVEVYSEDDHKLIKDELKADPGRVFQRERKILRQHVERSVFSGEKFLEKPERIVGKWLPIIPVYGYRGYVDGVEWYRGLVRKLKDASRLFNMQVSQLAENSASNGQEVPIFDPDQMLGDIGKHWADKNNKAWLPARSLRDDDGKLIHHGPTGYLKPPMLDGSTTALLELVPNFIRDITGGVPQDTLDPNASGKAINAIIKRANLNIQPIFDNIGNSLEWSGEVYAAMVSELYVTPRILNIIGKDGTENQKQILKMVVDEESGRIIESNNLRGKKFHAYADTGPQYETMREQTVEDLKGMLEAMAQLPEGQQYTAAILSTILENITGVGLGPLKEMNRRIMLLQGLVQPETDEEKALLEQASQPQPDPQQELIAAATEQQLAEARNLDAATVEKGASAVLKQAQAQKTLADIETSQMKTLAEIRNQVFQNVTRLPLGA